MRLRSSALSSSRHASLTIFSSSVPTSLTVPACTASGRSVFSRITSSGLPSEGTSYLSWRVACLCGRVRLHRFGPFRLLAHHQDRFTERGAFLLDASRVGENQPCAPHQIDERHIVQRVQQIGRASYRE